MYTYLHNLQGDIVGIVDNEGALVVEYKYDAWGKPNSTWTLTAEYQALAVCNPFRYRGYAYDEETGLYYLRSRYYSPQIGRFLIPDLCIKQFGDVRNANLYIYCKDNPVLFHDIDGQTASLAAFIAVAAVIASIIIAGSSIYISRKHTLTSESAKKHLDSLMGEGYSSGITGRFYGSVGRGKITTAEMELRKAIITAIDAAISHFITKNIFDIVGVLSKIARGLEYAAVIGTSLVESPLDKAYGVRDGEFTYYNYTWYTTIHIWRWDIDIGSITYTVRDYGQGYVEVWLSTYNYIFPEASVAPVKIKPGEIA